VKNSGAPPTRAPAGLLWASKLLKFITGRCHGRDGYMRRGIEDNSGRVRLWLGPSSEEAR
jgi:hypothetical protein